LIAEDDGITGRTLKGTLSRSGYDVTLVANGADALATLKQGGYEILITDWMMPRMDGIRLVEAVRKEITLAPTIVMLTALGADSAKTRAIEAGADEVLVKPVQPKQVLDLLARLRSRSRNLETSNV
jgi:DNA-binding response OmpR family regulator